MNSLWIRSPWWDSFWILSGFPIGLALLLLSPNVYLVLAITMLLEHAHLLLPMSLAWSHSDFRGLMVRRPMKFIGVPILLILTTVSVGVLTNKFGHLDHLDFGMRVRISDPGDYRYPYVWLVVLYFLWNGYTFGMPNFGVMSICRVNYSYGQRT